MQNEPIYCAEQIAIPPDLGEILKAYSKEVIRQNPSDIVAFSAEYFEKLSQNFDDGSAAMFEPSDLVSVYVQLTKLGRQEVTFDEFRQSCEIVGLPSEPVERIAELRQFGEGEAVDWQELLVLLCITISQDREGLVQLLFYVFGNENEGALQPKRFGLLFSYVHKIDHAMSKELLQFVSELSQRDGLITFDDFVSGAPQE